MKQHRDEEFEAIYRDYFREVFLYLLSLCRDEALADELTQEAFFKAMGALGQFRGDCQLRTWLCQIAKNEYRMYCRKNGKLTLCDADTLADDDEYCGGRISFEERLEDDETAFDLHKILHTLEEPYKEVFWLRTFGELSFKKIAELFGHTESWARVTYHRARLKIIEKFGDAALGGKANEQDKL